MAQVPPGSTKLTVPCRHSLTIMAADTAVVGAAGMAVLPGGTEEAVIRAALVGMALVLIGTTLAVAGTAAVVTGTAVVGIMVVTVAAGELVPQ